MYYYVDILFQHLSSNLLRWVKNAYEYSVVIDDKLFI